MHSARKAARPSRPAAVSSHNRLPTHRTTHRSISSSQTSNIHRRKQISTSNRRSFSVTKFQPTPAQQAGDNSAKQSSVSIPTTSESSPQNAIQTLQSATALALQDHAVTNPSFNNSSLVTRQIHKTTPGPQLITEDGLLGKIQYEQRLEFNRFFRFSEFIRGKQSAIRALALGVPAAAVLWASHDVSMYLASLVDVAGLNTAITADSLMALGAIQAVIAFGLFRNVNKILDLSGQPSEAAIQDIIRRVLRSGELPPVLGEHFKIGHFNSVSVRPSGPRLSNNKAQHYAEWKLHDTGKFTALTPNIPFPNLVTRVLAKLPLFQSIAWNSGAELRVERDLEKHPEHFISPDSLLPKQTTKADAAISDQQAKRILEQAAQTEAQKSRIEKSRKFSITNYSGWERYWQPRRLQFTTHLIGDKDEGLLLSEIEKFQFGQYTHQNGGIMQYKVLQFISFKTGQVVDLMHSERPSLTSHAHVASVFDVLSRENAPRLSEASFDHILTQGSPQEQLPSQSNSNTKL